MDIGITTITVLAILFISSLVRAVFGFGNALVAMPLLAMTSLGMQTATPIVALIATIMSFVIIVKDWKIIDLKSTWRLLAATVPGIPFGLLLLKGPYEAAGKVLLALVIIGFSFYCLIRPRLVTLKREWAAYPFGFIAGILGQCLQLQRPPDRDLRHRPEMAPGPFPGEPPGVLFPGQSHHHRGARAGRALDADRRLVFSPVASDHHPVDSDRKHPQPPDPARGTSTGLSTSS